MTGSQRVVSVVEWAELSDPAPELCGFSRTHVFLPGLGWQRLTLERTSVPSFPTAARGLLDN